MNSLKSPPPSTPLSGLPSGATNSTRKTSRRLFSSVRPSKALKASSTRAFRRMRCGASAACVQGPRVDSRASWSDRMAPCSSTTRSLKGRTCGISARMDSSTFSAPVEPASWFPAAEGLPTAAASVRVAAPLLAVMASSSISPSPSATEVSAACCCSSCCCSSSLAAAPLMSTTGALRSQRRDSGTIQASSDCRNARRRCLLKNRLTKEVMLLRSALADGASTDWSGQLVTK
mmetsp:Transcript_58801/g.157526  ORF Transcript_58801/g.157526 Transcript_58801/m.157526 type:complete len:232 (+) Transcript_58801:968-1663(+)